MSNSSHPFSFSKRERLLYRRAFDRVMRQGLRFFGKWLIIESVPSKNPYPRLGITVTKKFGSSPERNRFKRICREAFRLSKADLPLYIDIHLRPRSRKTAPPRLTTFDVIKELQLFAASKNRPLA